MHIEPENRKQHDQLHQRSRDEVAAVGRRRRPTAVLSAAAEPTNDPASVQRVVRRFGRPEERTAASV